MVRGEQNLFCKRTIPTLGRSSRDLSLFCCSRKPSQYWMTLGRVMGVWILAVSLET